MAQVFAICRTLLKVFDCWNSEDAQSKESTMTIVDQ